MNLSDTFNTMALQLLTDPSELVKFANEDQIGGYNSDPAKAQWPIGSLWEVEGKVLYALIRKYQPSRIVEIGTLRGCSTAHMATAIQVNGGDGHITAIDIAANAGDLFPAHLRKSVTPVTGDGLEWLAGQEDESIDFLFEDSSHGEQMCASIAALCKTKLAPGGLFVTHDAAHFLVGADIRRGLTRALGDAYRVYLSEPSDCGFALWRKPVSHSIALSDAIKANPDETVWGILSEQPPLADVHSEKVETALDLEDAPSEDKPVETPKRKRGRPAKKDSDSG